MVIHSISSRLKGCGGWGLGAALAHIPEGSGGLGWDLLPVGSHVFTSVWMISVIQTALTHLLIGQFRVCGLSSLLFLLTAILGQDPVYWIPKSSEVSISCCTEQQQLMQEEGVVSSVGEDGYRSVCVCVCVCVFGWLKAGWGVSSQMLGLQLAGWVGGELHWKAAVPAKWGLARHWEEIIHISSASSSSSQPPAEQHNTDPEHE